MEQKRINGIFIIITGIIIAFGRTLLNEENGTDILVIMAIINCVALGFVFLFLHNKLANGCKRKIETSGLSTNKKKLRKNILTIYSFLFLLFYLLISITYILKHKSAKGNDAISIFALALSIATDDICDGFKNIIYKYINNISHFLEKIIK